MNMATTVLVPRGNHIYDEVIDRVGERPTLFDTLRSLFVGSSKSTPTAISQPLLAFSKLRNAFAVTVAEEGCLVEIHINLDGEWLHPPLYNKQQGYSISQLEWCPYSDTLLATTQTGLCIWRLFGLDAGDTEKSWMSLLPAHHSSFLSPCPHGRVIATASSSSPLLTLHDISTLQQSIVACVDVNKVSAFQWSPSAEVILVGSSDGVVTLIRCSNWQQEVLYQLPSSISCIVFIAPNIALLTHYLAIYPLSLTLHEDVSADIAPVPFQISEVTLQAILMDTTLLQLTRQALHMDNIEATFPTSVSIRSLQSSAITPHIAIILDTAESTLPYVIVYMYNNKYNFTMLVHRVCIADSSESEVFPVPLDMKFRPTLQRGKVELAILWSNNSLTLETC